VIHAHSLSGAASSFNRYLLASPRPPLPPRANPGLTALTNMARGLLSSTCLLLRYICIDAGR